MHTRTNVTDGKIKRNDEDTGPWHKNNSVYTIHDLNGFFHVTASVFLKEST